MLLMVQSTLVFCAYMSRGIGALYGWGKKGAHHGARHQYFSNHFSRSSDGDGLRGLGHVQESFVTKMVSSSVASKAAMKADIASA